MPAIRHTQAARPAFTLIEAAISTVIVGVMVAAALSVVGGAARGSAREREWRRSQSLASSLMSEILAMAFSDPQGGTTFGVESGENATKRSAKDDVDDFDNWLEKPPADAAGVAIDWAGGWQRSVEVENVALSNLGKAESDSTDTGLRRITVTVLSPSGETRVLTALRTRGAIVDANPLEVGVTRVSGARISLQVGTSGTKLVGAATIFNSPRSTLDAAPAAVVPADPK